MKKLKPIRKLSSPSATKELRKPAKKLTPLRKVDYKCKACSDTGKNSKGGACIPCMLNKSIPKP